MCLTSPVPSGDARVEVDVVRTEGDLAGLLPEWRRLAAMTGGVFAMPSVALPWWEHLGRGNLHVVAARRKGRLLALMPLHERRIAGRGVLRWLGHGLGVVGEVVHERGDVEGLEGIWQCLAESKSVLELTSFRHGGFGLQELRRAPLLETRLVVSGLCPVVELDGTASLADWLVSRPGLAKSLRRLDKGLDAASVRFEAEVVTSADRVRTLLPQLRAVSRDAEEALPRLDLFASPWQRFTETMLQEAALTGELVLVAGWFGGELGAFDVGLRSGSTLYDIYGRYDPLLARHSPGTLVQREIVRAAIEVGVERVDLQLGDHPYKRRWADHSYDAVDVLAAPADRIRRAAAWQHTVLAAHRVRTTLRGRVAKGGST